jgi:hypothetical protein
VKTRSLCDRAAYTVGNRARNLCRWRPTLLHALHQVCDAICVARFLLIRPKDLCDEVLLLCIPLPICGGERLPMRGEVLWELPLQVAHGLKHHILRQKLRQRLRTRRQATAGEEWAAIG